ncbi:hypothetical protein ACWECC_33155 [Streptomyces microflavus]
MRQNTDTDAVTATIHLQGVGRVPAAQASKLKVGDQLMYNYGGVYQITKIEDATPKFFLIFEMSAETGEEHSGRVKKDRLVARVPEASRRRLGHDAPTTDYRAQVYAPQGKTWITVGHGTTVEDATQGYKAAHFSSSILRNHGLGGSYDANKASIKAMANGETLTAADGHRFRILAPTPAHQKTATPAVAPAAARVVTVTTGFTRKSIPTRLRESGAPGRMVNSEAAGGALRWRLPNGKELTPGEAEKLFLA